jgi:N-acyl-L-homoserine lactone synthetase
MENITFNLSTLHLHGSAFYDFLRLRKRFFVDTLGWHIPHDDFVEMDQYDNPKAWYSLVLRDGEVIGGARAMATTATWGGHSYMLRDAVQGKLIDIPPEVLGEDIVSADIWECTRLVMSETVETQAERSACLTMIVQGLINVAADQGATQLMSLSPLCGAVDAGHAQCRRCAPRHPPRAAAAAARAICLTQYGRARCDARPAIPLLPKWAFV